MKYVFYEIKKLLSTRYVVYCILSLFTLNVLVCTYQIRNDYDITAHKYANPLFDSYLEAPESVTSEYEDIVEFNNEQNKIAREQIQAGNYAWTPQALPNKYAPDEYTDLQLFNLIFNKIDYIDKFPKKIESVIRDAVINLNEYDSSGITSDTYTYKYQLKVIDVYDRIISSTHIEPINARGWDSYFTYDASNIFIFISVIIICSTIVIQEKSTDFLPIILASKNGRFKTALSKIGSAIIINIIMVILYAGVNLCIIGACIGFCDPNVPIQVFEYFVYCPYIITIGEYFVISLAVRVLTISVFSLIVMTLSVFIYQYVTVYIFSLSYIALNLVFYINDQVGMNAFLSYSNAISMAAVHPLLIRYRAIDMFSNVVDYIPFIIAVSAAVLVILSALFIYKYTVLLYLPKPKALLSDKKHPRITAFMEKMDIFHKYGSCRSIKPLAAYELRKLIMSSGCLIMIVLLVIVKFRTSETEFENPHTFGDAVYKEYMTILAGEYTEEKKQFLIDERNKISSILAEEKNIQKAYMNNEISIEEYNRYLVDYNYAYSRNGYLTIIEQHAGYINRLESSGREAWFLYDTGWKKLFFADFDFTLYALLLLIFSKSFTVEYDAKISSGGFSSILRTTKRGRKATFRSKYFLAVIIPSIAAVIWGGIDLSCLTASYDLPLLNAPIASIESFESIKINMTVWQYLIVFYCVKIFASIILGVLICSLSEILKKYVMILSAAITLTLLPSMLDYFGASIFSAVDYVSFMRVTPMLLQSYMIVFFAGLCLAISVLLMGYVKRSWCL